MRPYHILLQPFSNQARLKLLVLRSFLLCIQNTHFLIQTTHFFLLCHTQTHTNKTMQKGTLTFSQLLQVELCQSQLLLLRRLIDFLIFLLVSPPLSVWCLIPAQQNPQLRSHLTATKQRSITRVVFMLTLRFRTRWIFPHSSVCWVFLTVLCHHLYHSTRGEEPVICEVNILSNILSLSHISVIVCRAVQISSDKC